MSINLTLLAMVGATTGLYNAAVFKPAVQSSLYRTNYAYRAVDGNNDGNYYNGHCQHTNPEYSPWWMVDLLGQFTVEQITLTNREDMFSRRLRNFTIDIFEQDPRQLVDFPNITGQVCYNQSNPLNGGVYNFSCSYPIVGRYVRIILRPGATETLHICEMEVLVGSSCVEQINFKRKVNTKLQSTSLAEMTVRNSLSCLRECMLRRSTDVCTAFNWVKATRSCQLFSVHPYLDIRANLTVALGTHYFSQSN
ncbi:fucolectin-like [Biomphalaria glabrata]|uniref:Fucolectin-like n=1 Tax=Biomphalaria glabrata TaxID=6526 RepID=A0A9W2ZHX2_BIOGL|nr:fucolectin-like [Biomphalaria glabrata]